ncbi:MAG: MFS transporter [Bacteroidota bacterium]
MLSAHRPHTYLTLFALWLMVFSASSQVIIISPILPRIGEALAVPETLLGTLVTSYAVMLSVFALIIGPISDKFGRRRVLLMGTVSMAVALLLHGVANSYWSLLIMRGLAGGAGGMLSGAAVAYIADAFPYERRGWANGWVMSGIAFGQIVGIPLGTLLADWMGFRAPFMMFALTMGAAVLLIWYAVPQPDVELDEGRLTVRRAIGGYLGLLKNPQVVLAATVYFLMFLSVGLYLVYLPTWLERTLMVSSGAIASLFLVGGLANVVAGPMAGQLSDRVGRRPLILASCMGFGLIMVATTHVVTEMWVAYLLFALAMITVGMRMSPLQALVSSLVPGSRRGVLMSLAISIGQVGIGIGSAVAGTLYAEYGYVSNTYVGTASIVVMALLVVFGLREPVSEASPAAAAAVPGEPAPGSTP